MQGWRIALKGLSDTFENLLPCTLASLTWWLSLLTVVLAPSATRRLFRAVDPRVTSNLERPSVHEAWQAPLRGAKAPWLLTLILAVPLAVLLSNLRFYSSGDDAWILLIPLWLILLISFILVGTLAFCIVSILDRPVGESLRLATAICLGQPRRVASTLLIAAPVLLLASVVVLPIFTLIPTAVAAIANRFVLASLDISIEDPLAPTDERLIEEAREQSIAEAARRFGP